MQDPVRSDRRQAPLSRLRGRFLRAVFIKDEMRAQQKLVRARSSLRHVLREGNQLFQRRFPRTCRGRRCAESDGTRGVDAQRRRNCLELFQM